MPRRKGGGVTTRKAVTATATSTVTSNESPEPTTAVKTKPQISKDVGEEVTLISTPVNAKRTENKKPYVSSFPDRLEWKMAHLNMPTTSTPKLTTSTNPREVTKKDIETAFGFDDSTEISANYSTLISPIAHSSPGTLVSPVWKVNPLSQRNVDCDPPPPPKKDSLKKKVKLRSIKKTSASEPVVFPVLSRNLRSSKNPPTNEDDDGLSQPSPVSQLPDLRSEGDDKKAEEPEVHVTLKKSVKLKSSKKTSESEPVAVPMKRTLRSSKKAPKCEDDDGPSPFSQLLDRYNEVVEKEAEEGELHVDPKKIVKTYSSRKRVKYSVERETEYDFVPTAPFQDEPEGKEHKSKRGRKKRTGSKKGEEDGMDEETKKWLAEKNKEFEEVLKVPLVIESSFSD